MPKKSARAAASDNNTGFKGAEAAPVTPAPNGASIDLNAATVDELQQLPGIGPSEAEQIVQYRGANGPFTSPTDLLRVPGLSQATFDGIAGSIITSTPGPAEPQPGGVAAIEAVQEPSAGLVPVVQPALSGPTSENNEAAPVDAPLASTLAAVDQAISAAQAMPASAAREPAPAIAALSTPGPAAPSPAVFAAPPIGPTALPAVPLSPPRSGPTPVGALPPWPVTPAASAPIARPARDWTGLMAMSVLSAMLGAVLALLAIAGLNQGTLLLNERPEIVALTNQLDQERSRADALQTEADSLRARLDALQGLSNQVAALDASLGQAKTAIDSLQSQTSSLDQRTTVVESQLTTVRAAVDRFDGFLAGLRALLDIAAPTPTSTPTQAPSRTPTLAPSATSTARPSDTPVPTWTPVPSQTPADTATAAASPTPVASSTTPATATAATTSTSTPRVAATASRTPLK